jgi:hypothetical protein
MCTTTFAYCLYKAFQEICFNISPAEAGGVEICSFSKRSSRPRHTEGGDHHCLSVSTGAQTSRTIDLSSSNATIGTCPSPCGDSPLSIAGNIISILTFAYALLAGLFYYYSVVVNASDEMSELLRAYIPLYEDGISLRHSTNEEEVKERGDWIWTARTSIWSVN